MFDIDYFKKINDTYGHHAGDLILKRCVSVIKESIKESDVFVRVGGEEFVIILSNCMMDEGAKRAEYIREKIRETKFMYEETNICITISMSVTNFHSGLDNQQILQKADKAKYQAKELGRNKVVIC